MVVEGAMTCFTDLVVADEMIEDVMKSGRIEAEKKGGIMRKKKEETQMIFLGVSKTKATHHTYLLEVSTTLSFH